MRPPGLPPRQGLGPRATLLVRRDHCPLAARRREGGHEAHSDVTLPPHTLLVAALPRGERVPGRVLGAEPGCSFGHNLGSKPSGS